MVYILLVLCAAFSANAQTAADKASTSTISGKVTMGGKGVSGVVVGLAIATPSNSIEITRLRAVTNEDGEYRFANVPANTYDVLVSEPQYVQSERTRVTIGKNEAIENIDVTLIRGGVITGRISDADGRAVVEEEIYFSAIATRGVSYLRTVRTDDRGVYRGFGIPPGRYIVAAGKDSSASFGRVGFARQRTYYPRALNRADATVIQVDEGSETTNIDIVLGRQLPSYIARGRIIDGDTSQPLPNAHLGLQFFFDANGSTSNSKVAESTKDGEFKIENLAPGKYAVYLDPQTDSELLSEPVRFEVTDQDIDGLLIKVSRGASVSGVVVVEGPRDPTVKPTLAGDPIVVSILDESQRTIPPIRINQDGSFRVTGLPPGRLMLVLPLRQDRLRLVRMERDGVVYGSGIEIKEREQITGLRLIVSQANGTIRGVVKLPEGTQLPAKARLLVFVRRIEDPTVPYPPAEADGRGQFLVQDLLPGTYEFIVGVAGVPDDQRPRFPRPTQRVVVTNGAIADVTITLQMPKSGSPGP